MTIIPQNQRSEPRFCAAISSALVWPIALAALGIEGRFQWLRGFYCLARGVKKAISRKNQYACMRTLQEPPPSGVTNQQLYEACMNAHGWKLQR